MTIYPPCSSAPCATLRLPATPAGDALPLPAPLASLLALARQLLARADKPLSADRPALEQRFLELISRQENTIAAICFSYACSVAEFDDLRQDALINLWRGLPTFRQDSTERTWVYRVTLNSCVSTIRRNARHGRESESLDSLYNLVEPEPSERRERVETLHRLIAHLNATDKAMILLWLDDNSYDDIATVMGMPRNTVATRLHRIREKLTALNKKMNDNE